MVRYMSLRRGFRGTGNRDKREEGWEGGGVQQTENLGLLLFSNGPRQSRAGHGREEQSMAEQSRAGQNKAGHDRAGQNKAEQIRAEHGRAEQDLTRQSNAGQSRAGCVSVLHDYNTHSIASFRRNSIVLSVRSGKYFIALSDPPRNDAKLLI